MKELAPIVFFVFNRPVHTRRVIDTLIKNELAGKSKLIIYSDGPKNDTQLQQIIEVRKFCESISGFADVQIIKREKNIGLANSIISGVSEVLNQHNTIIVIEDDLLVSPYFLDYMNQGLKVYEDFENVASIHGYIYPIKTKLPATFFLRGADCWGWATWKRAWATFEQDPDTLIRQLMEKNLVSQFDYNNSVSNFKMLKKQSKGKIDSWAIRWHASCFIQSMFTLYPGNSLITNIGNDDSGTHTISTNVYDTELFSSNVNIEKIDVFEDPSIRLLLENYFSSINISFKRRLLSILRRNRILLA